MIVKSIISMEMQMKLSISPVKAFGSKVISPLMAAMVLAVSAVPAMASGPGWTANSTVTKLVVTANGGINVFLSPSLGGCVPQSGYGPGFASIYPDHPGINRIKADLLVAYQTGGVVALYLSDKTCQVTETLLGGW